MKNFILIIFLIIICVNCESSLKHQEIKETKQQTIIQEEKIEPTPTSKSLLETLTGEEKRRLEKNIPLRVRKILEKSEQFIISDWIETEKVVKSVKITDEKMKREFLDAFYEDIAKGGKSIGCEYSPGSSVNANFMKKFVSINIFFRCNHLEGVSSFGKIYGDFNKENSKSLPIFNQIIKRYGVVTK